jgi:hypothetical protein
MPIFGIHTKAERDLTERVARLKLRVEHAEKGRDRLAHALIYKELSKDKPLLSLVSSQLLGAGYTKDQVTTLLEETKREHAAEH